MIRKLEEKDAAKAAELHRLHIRGALLPELGDRFLQAFYRALINNPRCGLFGWVEEGRLLGFICGVIEPKSLMMSVLPHILPCMIPGFFSLLFRDFHKALNLAGTPGQSKMAAVTGADGELLFIALDDKIRGGGASDRLVAYAVKWLKDAGVRRVMVSTASDNKGAKALLERAGFRFYGEAVFRGVPTGIFLTDV